MDASKMPLDIADCRYALRMRCFGQGIAQLET